jgi:hypothetical protein
MHCELADPLANKIANTPATDDIAFMNGPSPSQSGLESPPGRLLHDVKRA